MLDRRSEMILAIILTLLSAAIVFVWVPNDTETGTIETFRRQTYIGDAFLPMIAGTGMLIMTIIHMGLMILRRDRAADDPVFDGTTFAFFLTFAALMLASFAVMFWGGAILWELLGDGERTYRQMRGTVPWKYVGFVLGGVIMIWGLISLIEGRLRAKPFLIALGFTAFLILLFDVPFDTLLLPPNGDW